MGSTAPTLFELPHELIVQTLAHLDFPSLASFVRASKACDAVFRAYPEHICRTISIRTGLADPKTGGAAAALSKLPLVALDLEEEPDQQELERVVRSQGWMGNSHTVTSWHAFAKLAHSIHRNWLVGRATSRCIVLDWSDLPIWFREPSFWRFKLDPPPGYFMVSGTHGGYFAFRHDDGKLVWSARLPHQTYPHVEASEGYFVQQLSGGEVVLWRRTDIVPSHVQAATTSEALAARTNQLSLRHNGATVAYEVAAETTPPEPCHASKLRFPILLLAPLDGDRVYRWNLETMHLETCPTPEFIERDEERVTYVEMDDRSVFLAGENGVVLVRPDIPADGLTSDGTPRYRTWPPEAPEGFDSGRASWYTHTSVPVGWEAVHHAHDAGGDHLVGIGSKWNLDDHAKLVWTSDYQDVLWDGDRDTVDGKTVVLVIDRGVPVQLAVENGRAVFVLFDEQLGSSLWLLNLRSFHDWEDFNANPPEPICLAYPLPTLTAPSRVEMTSSAVYLPANAAFFPPAAPSTRPPLRLWRAFRAMQRQVCTGKKPVNFHWEMLSGERLAGGTTDPLEMRVEPIDLSTVRPHRLPPDNPFWDTEGDADLPEIYRMMHAWLKVKQAAVADNVGVGRASDAFAVWDFAPREGAAA